MSGVLMPWADQYKVDIDWVGPLPPGIHNHERRFDIETRGPWNIISKVRGLAVRKTDQGIMVYGDGNLLSPRESGYQMEGYVSVDGRRVSAFTSSQLFRGPDGKLFDVAILYMRSK